MDLKSTSTSRNTSKLFFRMFVLLVLEFILAGWKQCHNVALLASHNARISIVSHYTYTTVDGTTVACIVSQNESKVLLPCLLSHQMSDRVCQNLRHRELRVSCSLMSSPDQTSLRVNDLARSAKRHRESGKDGERARLIRLTQCPGTWLDTNQRCVCMILSHLLP